MKKETRLKGPKQCSPEGSCCGMQLFLECQGHSGKGMVPVYTFSRETGKTRFIGIRYQSKPQTKADKGTMLNYCPWCGTEIRHWEEKKTIQVPDSDGGL